MHNQRIFTQLQALAGPPFPTDVSAVQGRAASNPEQGRPQPQGGPLRHLPGSPGQFSVPQVRFPLQRLTPSTEVLEHVHPGSTSRGDFHSSPAAHNAMETCNSGPPSRYVALPSRGLPGPFSYRPLPPPYQMIPLTERVGSFNGNVPKGKKNPKKKSSDDARVVFNTSNGQRHASHGADPKQPVIPHDMQLPLYFRSPVAVSPVQQSRPSSGAVPDPGNHHQSNLPPGQHLGSGQELHQPYHRQSPMQPATDGRSRAVSNPYAPPAHELQGPTQDPQFTLPTPSVPTNVQHQGPTAKGQLFEEHAGYVSTRARPHISQPLHPNSFGHHLSDSRMGGQDRQNPNTQFERPALAPLSNAGQPPFPGTTRRAVANEPPRCPVQEGCTIWIGGFPSELDKAAVIHLLSPCRGVLDVSQPKVSSPQRTQIRRSYVFAEYVTPVSNIVCNTDLDDHSFQSPVDAAEALERLPLTQFADMPEGAFLSTNYPRPKQNLSSGQYHYGGDVYSKRPVSNVSPTKLRKGEDSNRVEKSKSEHGRKQSKGSFQGKKQSISSSEGKKGRYSKNIIAMDAGQKEPGLQPEEAVAVPDLPYQTASTAHVSRSCTERQEESKPINQDAAVVQPDISVEAHANQVLQITGDGAQEIALAPNDKPHQAPSSRYIEGRAKAPKKKSKGSNKLPVPENKGSEPPTVQPVHENSMPTAWTKLSANDAGRSLKNNNDPEDDGGNPGGSKIEASKVVAPAITSESTLTLRKDLETPDQSFLDRNPTEDHAEMPKASVANVTKPSSAKADSSEVPEIAPALEEPIVSAVSLEQPKEPISQVMTRDGSSSTQGSTDTASFILSSTAPPSSSQTERSNSITQETRSPTIEAAFSLSEAVPYPGFSEPGGTVMQLKSEPFVRLALSKTGKGTERVQEELQKPTHGVSGGLRLGLIEENPEQNPSTLLIHPSPSNSDRALLKSPVRKRAPSIPPRSSSLAAPSTPIKTHQKKKPRNFKPANEVPSGASEDHVTSPSKVTGLAVEDTDLDSSVQTMGSTKPNFPVLTIDPAARTLSTEKVRDLPQPETPFLMDNGVRVAPPKLSRQTEMEASTADRYYAQKNHYQIFHLGNAMHFSAIFNTFDYSDPTSTHSSETSTPGQAPTKKQDNDLETTLREAGFRSLSGTSPFTIRDPDLAFLETIIEHGNPPEKRSNRDGQVVSFVDNKGRISPGMSLDAWTKQHEMIEVVKKATAVKRLLAGSPAGTKVESLRQQLSQFAPRFSSDAQEQQNARAKAQQILWVKALLDTVPQPDSSISEKEKWSRNASLFLEEHASEPSPFAQSRKPTANSPSKLSRGTPLRKQQQERRHPELINKPGALILARKFGADEDAFQTANTEMSNHLTSGQSTDSEPSPSTLGCRTPSKERSTPSVALVPPAALNQVSNPIDIFVGMRQDRRCWIDDRHPLSTPQEEERVTNPDSELKPSGEESDMCRVAEVKNVEPGPGKEMENEVQKKPCEDEQSENKGKELVSEGEKPDQSVPAKSGETKDATPSESKENAPKNAEDLTPQKQTSHPLELSFSSFDGSFKTSDEGSTEEAQHDHPRSGQNLLKQSGYNAVAGRGPDVKRVVKMEGSKDPWALPRGEKPWGNGGEGRGEKKKRQRQ